MRKIIATAIVVLAPVLAASPAGAAGGPESFADGQARPLETDLVPPRVGPAAESQNSFGEYVGDPLQIIVWPNDTRRYSLGTDVIGVYLCTWTGDPAAAGIDLADATATLNAEVTPFYYEISDGRYLPSFQARKTLTLSSPNSFNECSQQMLDDLSAPNYQGAIGILDNKSNAGLATPGDYCAGCEEPALGTAFPANRRWAVIEGESVQQFFTQGAHVTTAAHELGHMISFPHSYSGVDVDNDGVLDEYDNPIDYMSGNMPAGLIGRRVEYPYSTLAFNRYRAGWVEPSDVVFYSGGVVEYTIAPVGVDGIQMVVLPTSYEYSLVTLDARTNSSIDPIPSNFEGISAHYIEQWWNGPLGVDEASPVGGALSRVYTYPPSPDSLDHVTGVGGQLMLDVDQGEDLLAQGTLLKVLGETADGFQIRLIGFDDTAATVFLSDILWLAEEGITKGCNPSSGNTSFCPNDYVTRGQMAAFLVRALGLSDNGDGDLFIDDDGNVFEDSIDKLATAGITKGCNPAEGNTKFCPDAYVTRGQMAAFLVRALDLSDNGGGNLFTDDDGNIFEDSIDKLATAGITLGCNPAEGNTKFCPFEYVTRGQMAAFLQRALG